MDMKAFPVIVNNEVRTYINPYLINKQNLSKNDVVNLLNLHIQKFTLEDKFEDNGMEPEQYQKVWTEIQNKIQITWKLNPNEKKHIFWEMKKCLCPKVENEDAYPTGEYFYSVECPVHKHLID